MTDRLLWASVGALFIIVFNHGIDFLKANQPLECVEFQIEIDVYRICTQPAGEAWLQDHKLKIDHKKPCTMARDDVGFYTATRTSDEKDRDFTGRTDRPVRLCHMTSDE